MLTGIKILDLSRLLPGPACTSLLRSMGAQVDRVESHKGELTRVMPPKKDGVGAFYAANNRGKRSLSIDFRHMSFR